jgi:hypothetical protein
VEAVPNEVASLSEFYGPKRNPYLRLNSAERVRLDLLWLVFAVATVLAFAIWSFLRGYGR